MDTEWVATLICPRLLAAMTSVPVHFGPNGGQPLRNQNPDLLQHERDCVCHSALPAVFIPITVKLPPFGQGERRHPLRLNMSSNSPVVGRDLL